MRVAGLAGGGTPRQRTPRRSTTSGRSPPAAGHLVACPLLSSDVLTFELRPGCLTCHVSG